MQQEGPQSDGDGNSRNGSGVEGLRDLARNALRSALHADGRASEPASEVRRLLRKACETARARNEHVEQLIVVIKDAWQEIPDPQQGKRSDAQAMLSHVVSLCIEEFYANRVD